MDIFRTIWSALTTENELLSNVIYLPIMFIESIINTLIFTTLLNVSIPKNKIKNYILLISSLLYITSLLIQNPYKSFINLIIIFLSIFLHLKLSIFKSISATILPIAINIFLESMILKIFTIFFSFNVTILVSIPIYRLLLTLAVRALAFIVFLLIYYFKLHISFLENMSKKGKRILILNLIIAIVAIGIQFLITGFYLNRLPLYVVIFSNLSLVIYFILSIYSLIKTTQLELANLSLEQEKESNRILKHMQDDLRGFRHDFSNIMCTIGGYVQVKDIEGLSNYYSQIQKDVIKINNLGALNHDSINNPAVFTLIASKYSKALECGIEMNINVFLDLNSLNMKIYEFTRILGILLDNAIEASKECNDKIINLEIRNELKRNRQILLIENTYNNKDVDTEKIYEKNYSTKEGNSGIGLWEVRQLLKRNKNLNLYTSKTNRFFKQQLEMYNI